MPPFSMLRWKSQTSDSSISQGVLALEGNYRTLYRLFPVSEISDVGAVVLALFGIAKIRVHQ